MGKTERKNETNSGADDLRRTVDALCRVARFASEVTDLKRLLTLIMEESKNVMDSEASSCMLYDETTDELYFEVALGEKGEEVKSIRLKRGQGFGGICLEKGETLLVGDVGSDARHDTRADRKAEFVTRNLIATPMRYREKTIGVLEVLNKRGDASYDAEDKRIMEVVADQAAMAIANARLVEGSIHRERLAAIGMAVSGVAHHLKNIILGVKAPIGLLRMAIESNNPKIMDEALPIIERASQRMERSVREMLAYSKAHEPELQTGNLNDVVAEVVEENRARAAQSGVELRQELGAMIGESQIDVARLHDVVLNLVANAIEAQTGRNASDLWVLARTRMSRGRTMQIVEVADNGPGIAPNDLGKIFEPFFSTKGSRGTGLGLAVAQKAIEENGGTLTVASKLGKGTVFTLCLPIVKPAEAQGSAV